MFRGAAKVSIDDKGRMVLPTRYRTSMLERSAGRLIVTANPDHCLLVYALPDWQPIEETLLRAPSLNPIAKKLQRLMVGYATEIELDSHGRIALTPELRAWATIERGGMLLGQGKGLELWGEELWAAQQENLSGAVREDGDVPTELRSLVL
jgi:MraZ protein